MIREVLEYYGADLTRVSERGWRSLRCPFHDDRSASASVNLEIGGFRCFACDVKGDALKLIMEREGVGYREAIEFARTHLGVEGDGIPRPADEDGHRKRNQRWRDRLFG